jgi:FkbM family methyltransferase
MWSVPDPASFLSAFEAIWVERIYDFQTDSTAPVIIDGGANIGLSVAFFKRRYPKSCVVAVEADPLILGHLEKNLAALRLGDVEVISKALWSTETELSFHSEGADGGHVAADGPNTVRVPTIRLSTLLSRYDTVDLLKLDIEGAELDVLEECQAELGRVERAFVEFHSFSSRAQRLSRILEIFEKSGFRVHAQPEYFCTQPFLNVTPSAGMDLRINLFFSRAF